MRKSIDSINLWIKQILYLGKKLIFILLCYSHLLPQIKDKSTSMLDGKDDNNLNITSLIQNIREGNKTEQKVNFESIKLYKDNEPRNQRLVSIDEYYWKAQKLPGLILIQLKPRTTIQSLLYRNEVVHTNKERASLSNS